MTRFLFVKRCELGMVAIETSKRNNRKMFHNKTKRTYTVVRIIKNLFIIFLVIFKRVVDLTIRKIMHKSYTETRVHPLYTVMINFYEF